MPSPELFFDTMNAYQRTAALKAAIELDLFSAVGDGATAKELAARCHASERGVRILADYLTIVGFMTKTAEGRYQLTPDTDFFLVRRSPAYIGGGVAFFATPELVRHSDNLTKRCAAARSTRRKIPWLLTIRSGSNSRKRCGRWSHPPGT